MIPLKFEQMPLFTGGYSLLTVQLSIHLEGRTDEAAVSYSITDPGEGDTVELGTLGLVGTRNGGPDLGPVMQQLIERARLHLLPF